jgi:SAM-dependent methyltransferase
VLTVDYDRLGLATGDVVLDLGTGFGRHAFETARRGAHVVAADLAADEVAGTKATFDAMADAGELGEKVNTLVLRADALRLPFADGTFDRVITSEVLEHVLDDHAALGELFRVVRPGGRLAVTVPAEGPERICWALNADYHAPGAEGGHVRIYSRTELELKLAGVGFTVVGGHKAHALHSPYWWLRCALGIDNTTNPAVRAYHRLLTWDILEAPRLTRTAERLLDPVLGKSLVLYADRPLEPNP